MEIRSGATSSFWFDAWSPLGRIYDLTNARRCIDPEINISATVEYAVQNYHPRRHRNRQLILIENEILRLRVQGLIAEDDVYLWKGKGDVCRPEFSSQQTWQFTREIYPTKWSKGIWFSGATPKYSVIGWIAIHNRLATGDRLLQWNAQACANCIFCQTLLGTRDHLFFSCPYSEKVWRNLTGAILGQNYSHSWNSVIKLLTDNRLTKTREFLFHYVFQTSVHTIWHERNKRRHSEARQHSNQIIKFIDKQIRNRICSLKGRGGKHLDQAMVSWFA